MKTEILTDFQIYISVPLSSSLLNNSVMLTKIICRNDQHIKKKIK